ncbi:hypothetical protein BDQ17DRAFT_1341569 [Cyathus striatus]|nr:hypothetical protein BDQ17DRAFT_1341569 [Cyathus striatus]
MSHPPAITASRSRLIHAALAHVSPQVNTLDYIIHTPAHYVSASQHQIPFLPLLHQSAVALKNYETSVRQLLCADCLAWNQDIYGADIWQWEQFSGGCACQDIGTGFQGRFRHPSRRKNAIHDSSHWLEFYLSCTLLRAAGHNDFPIPSPSTSAVWHTVCDVLGFYGCEALCDGPANCPLVLDHPTSRNVIIVPLPSEVTRYERERTCSGGSAADHLSQIILQRVSRDLGLGLDDIDTEISVTPSAPRSSAGVPKRSVSIDWSRAIFSHLLLSIFHIIAIIIGTCLSLPLTFATIAVTVFCFYSRPRCMRIV